jgi:drug/metabolite transporter (DMT)-like permease
MTPLPAKEKFLPYVALVSGILALSLSSLFVRWAEAPGAVTSFYRMAVATVVFLPLFLRQPVARRKFDRRWLLLPLIGGIFTAFDHATWATAINFTRVANATLMNNLAPLWVALVAFIFWREKLNAGFWLGLLMAIGGAAVVLGSDFIARPQLNQGNLLAVGSSFFYAAYFLTTQRGREHFSTLSYIFLITATCSLVLFFINIGMGNPFTGFSSTTYLSFLGAGLISQVIGYFSVGYALGHLPASIVSPTMIAQPVLTALMAIPLAGEPLVPAQWIGGLVVLSGIYLVNSNREKRAALPSQVKPLPSDLEPTL